MTAAKATVQSLTLEVVSSADDLSSLQPEWTGFVRGQSRSTLFQLPEWLITWWKHFGSGELRTWVFRNNGRLAGIIPCFLHEWEGRRQLTLAGTGISDYLEPIIAFERRPEIAALLAHDLGRYSDWDLCVWQDLDSPSVLAGIQSGARFTTGVEAEETCSRITIEGSFDRYWAARPHGLRRNVRRYLEKAKQIDTAQFAVTSGADAEALSGLIALHTARWNERGESGMFAANQSAGFLEDAVHVLAEEHLIRFFTLRFQGRIAAVILGFAYRRVLYSYLSGFDPEYQQFGLGRLLLFESLHYAFDNGFTTWNFLRGSEPYKFDWGAEQIPKERVIIRRLS